MTFDKFTEELYEAGWKPASDAQYAGVQQLWFKLIEAKTESVVTVPCSDGLCAMQKEITEEITRLQSFIKEP